ncbi:hypothetical protein [Parvularcula dongshanensis]|uniref:DUF4129 domain-containing protein n=1 Tax=Parvularcula dongshanensis TaxID=1173995 RepID=A0A840I1V4_9PROT|nr:hypothetical protein [Parvularcula dongshanensis]MBB4658996.1 hypothetical protein [Parvularcula dongshanensis]
MQAGQSNGATGAEGAGVPDGAAYDAVRADPRYQFEAEGLNLEPREPSWLQRLLESPAVQTFLEFLGKALEVLFWVGLAAIALAVLWFAGRAGWQAWQARRGEEEAGPAPYRPAAGTVRVLLEDADRLASEGRYAEAVRLLLHRSIADVERQRPGAVRDAMTSREIARLPVLTALAAEAFAGIAGLVERAHFAGRELTRASYDEARETYARLAAREAWS